VAKKNSQTQPDYFNHQLKESLMYMSGVGSLICLGAGFPTPTYAAMTSTLSLSGVAGYYTVWNIKPGRCLCYKTFSLSIKYCSNKLECF
jgi:hypothetical protein